jgi:hypothetical protein
LEGLKTGIIISSITNIGLFDFVMNKNKGNLTKGVKDAVLTFLYKQRKWKSVCNFLVFCNCKIIESIVKKTDCSLANKQKEEKPSKFSPKMKKLPSQKTQSSQKKSISSVKKTKKLELQL